MDDSAAAWTGHTRWQRFIRFLFRYMGPAQTGMPIYPSPEERARYESDRAAGAAASARTGPPAPPPPGYEVRVYTDAGGTVHRSIVRTGEDPER